MTFWERLGIAPTLDVSRIRSAYAARSRQTHPEDAPEDFALLYKAYQEALDYARSGEKDRVPAPDVPDDTPGPVDGGAKPAAGAPVRESAPAQDSAPVKASHLVFPAEASTGQPEASSASRPGLHFEQPSAGASAAESIPAAATTGGLSFAAQAPTRAQLDPPAAPNPLQFAPAGAAAALAMPSLATQAGGSALDFTSLLQALGQNALLDQTGNGVSPENDLLHKRRLALLDSWLALASNSALRETCATWSKVLDSPEFRVLKTEPVFIVQLSGFCRDHAGLPLALLAELYTEYELYSESAYRTGFGRLLRARLGVAASASARLSMGASELRAAIRRILEDMTRLNASSRCALDAPGWLLILQSPRFRTLSREPLMVLELMEFLEKVHAGQALLTALARSYEIEKTEGAGVFARLHRLLEPFQNDAARLAMPPTGSSVQDLLDPAAEDQLRERLVDRQLQRLKATALEFRFSPRREPWDAVLRSPECLAVLDSPLFLNKLASFLERKELPAGALPALRDACSEAGKRSVSWPPPLCQQLTRQQEIGHNRLGKWKRPALVLTAVVGSFALIGLLLSLVSPYAALAWLVVFFLVLLL